MFRGRVNQHKSQVHVILEVTLAIYSFHAFIEIMSASSRNRVGLWESPAAACSLYPCLHFWLISACLLPICWAESSGSHIISLLLKNRYVHSSALFLTRDFHSCLYVPLFFLTFALPGYYPLIQLALLVYVDWRTYLIYLYLLVPFSYRVFFCLSLY